MTAFNYLLFKVLYELVILLIMKMGGWINSGSNTDKYCMYVDIQEVYWEVVGQYKVL